MQVDPVHARSLLGLGAGASAREVQSAFRQRAKELHPDTSAAHRRHRDREVEIEVREDASGGHGAEADADIGRLREARDVLLHEQLGFRHHADRSGPRRGGHTDDGAWQPYTFDLDLTRPAGVYRQVDGAYRPLVDLRV